MPRLRSMAPVVALLVSAAACTAGPAKTNGGPRDDRPVEPALILVDADAHGALLIDGRQRRIVGIRRDGTTAWQAPLDNQAARPVRCMARCPDAVLSASVASFGSPSAPDPEPVLVVDGQRHPVPALARRAGPKRRVLTAAGPDDYVTAGGDEVGGWWLEGHRGTAVTRVAVGGFLTSWQESADGRHAVAVTAVPGGRVDRAGNEARWFHRGADGWQPVGPTTPVAASSACVRLDGQMAVLIGRQPAGMGRDGSLRPVGELGHVGTCALSQAGGLVAELANTGRDDRTRLRFIDAAGNVTARVDIAANATVTADPTAARVTYVTQGTLHEVDPRSGRELRRFGGIQAAKYDRAGGLVVVRDDGTVGWIT